MVNWPSDTVTPPVVTVQPLNAYPPAAAGSAAMVTVAPGT